MPRGLFPQVLFVLTSTTPTVAQLENALGAFGTLIQLEPGETSHHGGAGVQLPCGPGRVLIDIVDHPWPDHMGDPEQEVDLFGAWTMGFYGNAYPGSLSRAAQHCYVCEAAKKFAEKHTAFLRLRSCHIQSGGPDEPLLPEDYDPAAELNAMHDLIEALSAVPGALGLFNPAGEILRTFDWLKENRAYNQEQGLPDLDIWTNVRLWTLTEDWKMMDTVGLGQLFLPDLEAVSHSDYAPNDVDHFLRNLSLYLLNRGQVFNDGDTTQGPGQIDWMVKKMESMADPPRDVLGWLPRDGRDVPEGI